MADDLSTFYEPTMIESNSTVNKSNYPIPEPMGRLDAEESSNTKMQQKDCNTSCTDEDDKGKITETSSSSDDNGSPSRLKAFKSASLRALTSAFPTNKRDSDDEMEDDSHLHQNHVPFSSKALDRVQSFRYQVGKAVNNEHVQLAIVLLIAINAIMMGIGTFDFVMDNPEVDSAFELVDRVFLIIFTIEVGMQFIYYGWRLLLDGWLVFDLIVILTSWSFASLQIIRAFRIFRALRLITRVKVMKNLVMALFSVIPRMFAIGLLLLLLSYIWAVLCTDLFKDSFAQGYTTVDYFGRLDFTFFTLFQITTLDNWADIARELMDEYSWAWLPIVAYVIATGFIVVNLIIAVICDAVSALHDDEKAKLHGNLRDDSSVADESLPLELQQEKTDMRDQLEALEDYVDDLSRMQEETLQALHTLTKQIQAKRVGQLR